MNQRLGLFPLLLTVLLAACSQNDAPAEAAATPDPAQPAATGAVAPADAVAAPDASGEAASAPAAEEADAPADASQAAAAPQPPQGPEPQPGTDYVEIPNGQPYQPLNGQVEVVEVFGYTCPACAQFEPLLSAWKRRQPADVRVTPVAAPFGGYWMPYARAFFAAESMGLVDETHQAMFEAIHVQRSLPVQNATPEAIGAFYAQHGVDAGKFASTMQSFAVNGKLKRAEQFIARAGVDSTPTLIVNGKYRVTSGRSYEQVLNTAEHLIARERAAQQP
ncbi:thiol:disulfide interchange protein DsbA/DsbL [Luteimonas sp. R10]|uniref:thiol:disulfide interchange protein DsbA/DsbL n=1 Tax=Luteimonas sp. R10 TaxID=3108176 RepID=UPI00308F6A69|nr:thiol:disulfide interchange protein DsbA/DsbL [Luteimonas sp. R10]